MISRRAIVVLAIAAPFLGGCSLSSAPSPQGTSTAPPRTAKHPDALALVRLTTYRGHGISFTYPASWRYRHRGVFTTMTAPVVDIASQPTRNPCTLHRCWFPVRHLRPGAVVVMWEEGGGLIDPPHPTVGVHVTVLRHACNPLGGGDELTARVVLHGGRVYEAYACLRGPNVAAHELEVRAMLASAHRAES
jgi:hypothetical protein